ncbi:NYN domain-containing protein [Acidiferrimicrobium sp. IK]|uniref:NYN domain-containing protein n=1 Tax=Acidiferrimicrobium sp. IK TaxID=2871700 RepID=UPI0021CB2A0D|nr:NYN domain-containing protein [Acidiferrimicrobium sp. IK]MCU4184086.1 NYN domain-containing protein [Acidiferrimicrobium sp. IK]
MSDDGSDLDGGPEATSDPVAGAGAAPEAVPVSLIRQGLEAAWSVGRAGLAATPPVEPPRRLRPLLRFAKLPAKSLAAVRDVVDSDDGFRATVAASVDPGLIEQASWLWLTRPDGWARELSALGERADAVAHQAHEGRAERQARRRLEAVEAARARSDEAAEAARQLAGERLDELTRERQARRLAEEEAAKLRAEIDGARLAAFDSAREAAEARHRAEVAEAAADELRVRLDATSAERDRMAGDLRRLTAALADAEDAAGAARAEVEDRRGRVAHAVMDAAAAAQALGAALARAGAEMGDDGSSATAPAGGPPGSGSGAAWGGAAPPGSPGAAVTAARRPGSPAGRRGSAGRRRPVPVPRGLFGDSLEVAAHLVRRPNVVILVDGYNVSLNTWPGVGLADQRQRLTAALGELAARTGAALHVVFDASAEEQLPPPAGRLRSPVRVSFSESGEDADEVLIDLVDRCDPGRPVVVATDDRRVRSEVERRGGNTISVAQLLGVIGRRPQDR